MKNIYRTIIASIKFALFWIAVIVQLPILILLPRGKISVGYSRFFWLVLMGITGVRAKVFGKLSKNRPLLLVSNHISVFEFATFPMAGLGSFFGKAEIAKMPLVGWVAKKFGIIFIDRNPRRAEKEISRIRDTMSRVSYPMTIFPEGTTNNGNFIFPFKAAMFDIVDKVPNMTVQPVVMVYRYHNGGVIDAKTMAEDFSYPDNKKIEKYNTDFGKNELFAKDRSAFAQVFHIMKIGGLLVEINLLPPPPLADMDRKQIAANLHEIINTEFNKLRNCGEKIK